MPLPCITAGTSIGRYLPRHNFLMRSAKFYLRWSISLLNTRNALDLKSTIRSTAPSGASFLDCILRSHAALLVRRTSV